MTPTSTSMQLTVTLLLVSLTKHRSLASAHLASVLVSYLGKRNGPFIGDNEMAGQPIKNVCEACRCVMVVASDSLALSTGRCAVHSVALVAFN